MYSYEDRIQAVDLCIKLGKRVRPPSGNWAIPPKMRWRAGIASISSGSICLQAMQIAGPSSRRSRRKQLHVLHWRDQSSAREHHQSRLSGLSPQREMAHGHH